MAPDQGKDIILGFSSVLVAGRADADAAAFAAARAWLDGEGRPTEDGLALLRALEDQRATRSVFRFVP